MLLVLGSKPVTLEALTSQAQPVILSKPIKKRATLIVKAKNENLFIVFTLGSCNSHFPLPLIAKSILKVLTKGLEFYPAKHSQSRYAPCFIVHHCPIVVPAPVSSTRCSLSRRQISPLATWLRFSTFSSSRQREIPGNFQFFGMHCFSHLISKAGDTPSF